MASTLKKRASNERMTSQSHIVESGSVMQNGGFLSADPDSYASTANGANGQAEPRSATNGYPAWDTALRDYGSPNAHASGSSTSNGYAPNGYTASKSGSGWTSNGNGSVPPPPSVPPPNRSSTLPPQLSNGQNASSHAHHTIPSSQSAPRGLNASLHPSHSPTSRTFARRAESPPASTYFHASPSSQHRMTPTPGQDPRELGEHFSFSTTLRRHTLAPTEDVLPFINITGSGPSSNTTGGGPGSVGMGLSRSRSPGPARIARSDVSPADGILSALEQRIDQVARPFAQRFGLQRFLFPRREDEEMNGTEFGYGGGAHGMEERRPDSPRLDKNSMKETASSRWAPMPVEDVVNFFRTETTTGISEAAIPGLRNAYGFNEFSVAPKPSMLRKFLETIYESPLNLLLLGSAAISAIMGNIDDAVSITIAILIVLTVGFVQERRSEESLEALNRLVPHHAHLLRDSQQKVVLANNLVPGDIVSFTVGDRIPADVRLLTALDLDLDESSLTGEAEVVRKRTEPCAYAAPLGERVSMAFMGTLVRNGRGSGIVVSIGEETEFGVIFATMQDIEEKRTPLQVAMDELGTKLSKLSFAIIGVICILGVLQSKGWLEMFTIGVSLAVAAIPEGLPIVTTVTLALGVLRMARRNAIVKKLPSVEALGSVSVICCDKTGTLTKNEQTVTEIFVVDELVKMDPPPSTDSRSPALLKTAQVGAICNNARKNEEGLIVGQSTDIALVKVLDVLELGSQKANFTVIEERPFSSEVKSMAVSGTHSTDARQIYYIKGAIEAILPRCKSYYVSDDSTPALDALTRSLITSKAEAVASRGLRVVAMAYGFGSVKSLEADSEPGIASRANTASPQANLIFTGFQAMMDPPRKGVSDAISSLQEGGVKVVMITGDAVETALAIGRQLGLLVGSSSSSKTSSGIPSLHPPSPTSPTIPNGKGTVSNAMRGCLTGKDLDEMDDRMLQERVAGISVFARTSPKHKMRIVDALQKRGAVVGMTGDGVNDAPALKMADIGVAMGSGTDVAKEAADVILVDDNFSTILAAVEEGKTIFNNIQHFLAFQLSTAVSALVLISLSTMFGLSNPLNAMQILFINILMDGPPSQSLGVDPADKAVMRKPPRSKTAPVIDQRVLFRVFFSAAVMVFLSLIVYFNILSDGNMSRRDQTMTFTCFVFLDLASAIQNRGLGCSITANRMLLTTVSTSFFVQLGLIYLPFMQPIFQTEALGFGDLMTLVVLGGIALGLHEGRRRYERKKEREGGEAGWERVEGLA